MIRRHTLAVVLCLAMLVGLAQRAFAHHYTWTMEDGNFQISGWSGYENWVNYWVFADIHIAYWADATTESWVTTALSNWSQAIPQIRTSKVSTKSLADITFEVGDCQLPNAVACHFLIEVRSDSVRKANYIYSSRVLLNTDEMTKGYEVQTAAHEFGHHLGMYDQYLHSGESVCNPSVNSIMDGEGCDGNITSPTSWDRSKIQSFYGGGKASDVKYHIYSGQHVQITWKDESAGERYYEVVFYRYGTNSEVAKVQVTENIGLKAGLSWIADRTIQYNWVPPSNGSYRACIRPYFEAWDTYGTQVCSTAFYWNN